MDDKIPRDLSLAGAALDASRLLLVIVDAQGLIVRVNHAVEVAAGRSKELLHGSPFHELAAFAEERASLREACAQLGSGCFPTGTLFHILTPAGDSRIVDWANVLTRDGEGTPPIAVCVGVELSERAAATEALVETEARQRILLEQMPAVVWSTDRELRFTSSVGSALTQLGLRPDLVATVGTSLYSYIHTDDDDNPTIAAHRQALEGQRVNFDTTWLGRDFQARVEPLVDARGRTIGTVGVALDITERRQIELSRDDLLRREQEARLEANRARERFQVLAEASKVLTRSLDLGQTVDNLAKLLVPTLADWCYVAHRAWNGGPAVIATAHADPARNEMLESLRSCRPDPEAPEGMPRVLRTGELAVYADIEERQLEAHLDGWPLVGTRDPGHLATIRALGMRSLLCVPLTGSRGIDAVMMLVSASDPHRYGPDEVALAQEIAHRAVVALDNARLFNDALEAVRARDQFLAVAAHELRTPLTSSLLDVQRLRRMVVARAPAADKAPKTRSAETLAEACERQLNKLWQLMEQLLDVSRIAARRFAMQIEEVDVAQVVRDVVGSLSADIRRAQCRVEVSAPPALVGRSDATRLGQVVTNLVVNALKFGAGHPVEVTIEALTRGVRLSVRDHGIGISPEDQSRIFDRFERAVSITHFGGLGLGLYVSGEIVQALGGTIRVESEPGQGALFVVELPRDSAAA